MSGTGFCNMLQLIPDPIRIQAPIPPLRGSGTWRRLLSSRCIEYAPAWPRDRGGPGSERRLERLLAVSQALAGHNTLNAHAFTDDRCSGTMERVSLVLDASCAFNVSPLAAAAHGPCDRIPGHLHVDDLAFLSGLFLVPGRWQDVPMMLCA